MTIGKKRPSQSIYTAITARKGGTCPTKKKKKKKKKPLRPLDHMEEREQTKNWTFEECKTSKEPIIG